MDTEKKKKVDLTLTGRHCRDGRWEETVSSCEATWYEKDGTIYLFYEEPDQGAGICRSRITIYERSAEVDRKGAVNAKITYETGKVHENTYAVPYGVFLVTTDTRYFYFEKKEGGASLRLEYQISMNGSEPEPATLEVEYHFK